MGSYSVYCHTNKITGQKYYGQTGREIPEHRFGPNGKRYTGKFRKAIDTYGWDAFTHEIMFTNLTKDEADTKEAELIASCPVELSLNVSPGGSIRKKFFDPIVTRFYHNLRYLYSWHPWGKYWIEELKKAEYDSAYASNFFNRWIPIIRDRIKTEEHWEAWDDSLYLEEVCYDLFWIVEEMMIEGGLLPKPFLLYVPYSTFRQCRGRVEYETLQDFFRLFPASEEDIRAIEGTVG